MSGIRVTHQDDLLVLTFDRVDKKNAITDVMYKTIADNILASADDAAVRVIVIRSEGDTFTAGNDIADFAAAKPPTPGEVSNVGRFLRALATAKKPVVAAVQGKAVGVGTTMLLHCDYVVLAETAVLITPFVNLALVPEAASSHLLPGRIGYVRAFAMFALGEPVPAKTAYEWGLANRLVPAAELENAALTVARKLATQPLGAIIATKRLMSTREPVLAQMEAESAVFAAQLQTPEAKEAFAAFAERRKPDFKKLS